MKIAYFVSEFYPVENAVAIRTRHHVDALLACGNEVTIFTGPLSKIDNPYCCACVALRPPANTMGFVHRLVREICFGLALSLRFILAKPFDRVIITSPPFFMSYICHLAARLKKMSYIIDIRDRYPQIFFSLQLIDKTSTIGRVLLAMEKTMYKKAVKVITVTSSLAASMKLETACDDVELVMNGYDEHLFNASESHVNPSEAIKLISHGCFGQFFDCAYFTSFVNKLNMAGIKFHCTLIGYGPKFEELRTAGLANLSLLDQIPQAAIAKHLAVADIGFSFHNDDQTMRDAFPVKIFEFIGAGLPCLVVPRNQGGLLVEENGFGASFSPDQLDSAVNFIITLASDRIIYKNHQQHIFSKRNLFSRQEQAKNFVKLVAN